MFSSKAWAADFKPINFHQLQLTKLIPSPWFINPLSSNCRILKSLCQKAKSIFANILEHFMRILRTLNSLELLRHGGPSNLFKMQSHHPCPAWKYFSTTSYHHLSLADNCRCLASNHRFLCNFSFQKHPTLICLYLFFAGDKPKALDVSLETRGCFWSNHDVKKMLIRDTTHFGAINKVRSR